jgi:transcriptional regulator with XRE-family HTH domain
VALFGLKDVKDLRMPVDKKWFKERLKAARMTQTEIARRFGVDRSAISLLLRGGRDLKMDEVVVMAQALQVRLPEIYQKFELPLPANVIDDGIIYAHAAAGTPTRKMVVFLDVELAQKMQAKVARTKGTTIERYLVSLIEADLAPKKRP